MNLQLLAQEQSVHVPSGFWYGLQKKITSSLMKTIEKYGLLREINIYTVNFTSQLNEVLPG